MSRSSSRVLTNQFIFPELRSCAAYLKADARRIFFLNDNFTYLLQSHCGSCCFHNTDYRIAVGIEFCPRSAWLSINCCEMVPLGLEGLEVVSMWELLGWDQCSDRRLLLCFLGGVGLQTAPSRLQAALTGRLCELSRVCGEVCGSSSHKALWLIQFTRSRWHPCRSY